RTPYKIAVAARHVEVARLLKETEQAVNGNSGDSSLTNYARAYLLGDLRKFSGWREEKISWKKAAARYNGITHELSDNNLVLLPQEPTLTELIWPAEDISF